MDSKENIHLITGEKKGLGDAYKRGFLHAVEILEADIIFQMDSDGQHDPVDIERLLEYKDKFEMVVGARSKDSQGAAHRNIANWIYNKM